MYVCMYVCICVCIHVYVFMYVCMHEFFENDSFEQNSPTVKLGGPSIQPYQVEGADVGVKCRWNQNVITSLEKETTRYFTSVGVVYLT